MTSVRSDRSYLRPSESHYRASEAEDNRRPIVSDVNDVSLLAEPSVRAKNTMWKLGQRITYSAEARFFTFLGQLLDREQSVMDPRLPGFNTNNTSFLTALPDANNSQRIQRHPTLYNAHNAVHLPPLPPLDFAPTKHRKRPRSMSLTNYHRWSHDFPSIRPGMSVRVVRAERTPDGVAQYVINVVDLHTKVLWVVRKRFRDLYRFRKEVKALCRASPYGDQLKYLFDIPFPGRSVVAKAPEMILRRRLVLDTFLRNIASLNPDTPLHVAVLGKLQTELCTLEFIRRLGAIDPYEDPTDLELKWLAFDLFRNLNSCCTIEGDTCQRFVHVFRNRVAVVQACVVAIAVDHKKLARDALRDLRRITTQIEKYVLDTLEPQYRRTIAAALSDSHTIEAVDDAIEEIVHVTVEDAVMVPLQEQIQYLVQLTIDHALEATVTQTMEHKLFGKSQTFFGIPESLQSDSNWGKACYHLSMMEERMLPCEKLKELVLSAGEIFRACQEKGFAYTESMSAMNADDFLPIHIYVVVHSGLQRPYFAKEFLGAMIHPSKMLGETGYFLTMFEAALKYVTESMSDP
ncbi:hypothetical protein SDRG_05307 [Saprolegnia diclina VS20]|uniref:VPS9 domain-containing protein n=1 Tax=Saprolegnia diclina (strain VS20) TaxID=1156394 RepID=T0QSU5_SAPDV|nr:hypothetical protein SDRG_05307 [Saprolegnia diclina VS20]EQC37080.1 hypothetical protein SDRG_05307 [Saprolegnia diclina VS20]|eukprot:XP_008609242.1 hypothetical protein SDRG_05307 [Saprolegnia diclina VS20]